jgi:membrane protein implicated in regulation of membrane protease activity
MSQHNLSTDFSVEALRGAPPVAVAATSVTGLVDWNVWVLILTALFLLLQIAWLGWKMIDRALGKSRPHD